MSELSTSVGSVLRQAREAQGLSIDQVVQHLKLSRRQIVAMEADDFSELPGNTFIKGFVRNYARFLSLDPAPLLEQLSNELPAEREQVAFPQVSDEPSIFRAASKRQSNSRMLWVLALTMGVLAGFGGVFWYLQGPGTPEIAVTDVQPLAASVPVEIVIASVASEAIVVSEPASLVASAQAVTPTTAPVASVPIAVVAQASSPAQDVLAARGIRIVTRQDSWVQIVDSEQQKLFTGILSAGSDQAWSGKPPYQVKIGNAPNARLYYRGKPVEMASSTRGDVATLELK